MLFKLLAHICRRFLVLPAFLIALSSCTRRTAFEVYATYVSVTNPARQYSVHAMAAYLPGTDQADSYNALITVTLGGIHHELKVKAEHFTPRLDGTNFLRDSASMARSMIVDPDLLAKFIVSVDTLDSTNTVYTEAKELFSILEFAGMGRKLDCLTPKPWYWFLLHMFIGEALIAIPIVVLNQTKNNKIHHLVEETL